MLSLYIRKGIVSCGIDKASRPSVSSHACYTNEFCCTESVSQSLHDCCERILNKHCLIDYRSSWYCTECAEIIQCSDSRQLKKQFCTRCKSGFCKPHSLKPVSLSHLLLMEEKSAISDAVADSNTKMSLSVLYDAIAMTIAKITSNLINEGKKMFETVDDSISEDAMSLTSNCEATVEVCQYLTKTVLYDNSHNEVYLASISSSVDEATVISNKKKSSNALTLGYVICHYLLMDGGLMDDNSSIYLCSGCYKECGFDNSDILKSLRKDFGLCCPLLVILFANEVKSNGYTNFV